MVEQYHEIKQKCNYLVQVDVLQVLYHKYHQNHPPEGFGISLQPSTHVPVCPNQAPLLWSNHSDKTSRNWKFNYEELEPTDCFDLKFGNYVWYHKNRYNQNLPAVSYCNIGYCNNNFKTKIFKFCLYLTIFFILLIYSILLLFAFVILCLISPEWFSELLLLLLLLLW